MGENGRVSDWNGEERRRIDFWKHCGYEPSYHDAL